MYMPQYAQYELNSLIINKVTSAVLALRANTCNIMDTNIFSD